MKLHQEWAKATPFFDDENLVSSAGLMPVMALAEQAGLSDLVEQRISVESSLVASAGATPAGKVTSIVAGMAAGRGQHRPAGSSPGWWDKARIKQVFEQVYAPATLGQFLRSFTHAT